MIRLLISGHSEPISVELQDGMQLVFPSAIKDIGTGHDITDVRGDLWEYDPSANSWTQKANIPGSGREWATGFSIGNKGYIGFGTKGGLSLKKDFWEYNRGFDIWVQKADFGGTARWEAVGFSIGNKGYIGTGASEVRKFVKQE